MKTIAKYMAVAMLAAVCAGGLKSQTVVDFPYRNYMLWEASDYSSGRSSVPHIEGLDFTGGLEPPSYGYHLVNAYPFNVLYSDKPEAYTIYGIALIARPPWNSRVPIPHAEDVVMDRFVTVHFDIFKEAPDSSGILQLIKNHTGYIMPGGKPDIVMKYSQGTFFDSEMDADPVYEFYFPEPITIEGTFLVAGYTSQGDTLFVSDISFDECSPVGYLTFIRLEVPSVKDWFIFSRAVSQGCPPYPYHEPSDDYFTPMPLPRVTEDRIAEFTTDAMPPFFPILVPEGTTATQGMEAAKGVRLMPNPAREQVTVTATDRLRAVEVSDMTGRRLMRRTLDGTAERVTLHIGHLPAGTYTVKVVTTRVITTEKLVVE